jgi:SpoVK/Ycf46/Vps4 family AAA+-type ATPase
MWKELLLGTPLRRDLAEVITPRRSFSDVILPESTRRSLFEALIQIEKHGLIFRDWGLGERHTAGTGLAFHFAGPPGTGKTICAEAVASTLGKKLLSVRYAEMESCWAGESGKNVAAIFHDARLHEAVLFFDEADSIASRRITGISRGYERETNQTVNILLAELERFPGVVIFATNLAANFDPAFERRIRTHILFEKPTPAEREEIWRVQVHPRKTPLAPDVNFAELAQRYEVTGGDIKNAVLKAAQAAAADERPDREKAIGQRHLVEGIEQVLAGKKVMEQSLFGDALLPSSWFRAEERLEALQTDLLSLRSEVAALRSLTVIPLPRWVSLGLVLLALAASAGLGWVSAVLSGFP